MSNSHERGIQVKKGESVDRALKRLKTKLDTEGIIAVSYTHLTLPTNREV